MTTEKANGLIVTAFALTGALVVVKDAATGSPIPVREFVGLTFASLGLAVLGQSAPTIAGGLAGLVMVSAVFVYGGPAWTAITTATTPPKSTASKKGAQ